MSIYHSHGKLLLTGEYVVLDGAMALALPTRFGQTMKVEEGSDFQIEWKSIDNKGVTWFEHTFSFSEIAEPTLGKKLGPSGTLERLHQVLHKAFQLNPVTQQQSRGYKVTTQTDFPLDWGLGSSSTLIANIAKWLSVDPYELLETSFGGSGYDVAVAMEGRAITYQLAKHGRSILSSPFDPPFKDQLFFVHLNKKQNSRNSIRHYRSQVHIGQGSTAERISSLTQSLLACTSLAEFKLLLDIHENIISQHINLPKVKSELFPDFKGSVKSLGGWGGDFILATGGSQEKDYFKEKGYHTIFSYSDIIL